MPLPSRSALARLALLALLARGPSAFAQPRDPAREAFEQGVAAMEGGRAHDALLLFETSQRLAPYPVVTYNLGLCHRSLGRTADAVDAFERYLAAPEPDAAPELLATVRAEVGRLRALLAAVQLSVTPASARVTVDGRRPERAVTDLLLSPGVHVIEAAAAGYRPERREVELEQGTRTRLAFSLVIPARVLVTPSVSEGIVSIDGRLEGIGPTSAALDPGDHRVEVRARGYASFAQTVHVPETGALRIDAEMRSLPASATTRSGWVIPVAIGGAALVAAAIVLGVVLYEPNDAVAGRWGTVSQ